MNVEQKRLAKAVALSDDVPELVAELLQRSSRIQNLEAQLLAAKRTPEHRLEHLPEVALVDERLAKVGDLRPNGRLEDQW